MQTRGRVKGPLMIVITGPTASGKSALAVALARRLSTEVISADSRQVYHGIPISTATPSLSEMEGVRHHLIDMLPLDAYYSASLFESDALRISRRLFAENGVAVVCGGSMMYVDALCHGIDDLPTVPEEIRQGLAAEWRELGDDWLLEELRRTDPDYFARVDLRNLKRVFHAVEISRAAGAPYSTLTSGEKKERDFRILKICLDGDRALLFGRINRRAEAMVRNGLVEEARSVAHLRHLNSLNTVGLKEMFAWFDGAFPSLEDAVARIQKNTRVYAKKQMTWYRRDSGIRRLDFADSPETNVRKILGMTEE